MMRKGGVLRMSSVKDRMIGTWRLVATVIEDVATGKKKECMGT
jgi:hypothetical protein